MSKDEAYKALVGVKATGPKCASTGMLRVKAGDPAASLLLDKLKNATPMCGETMPIGAKFDPNCVSDNPSVCNTQPEISLVQQWIAAGANND